MKQIGVFLMVTVIFIINLLQLMSFSLVAQTPSINFYKITNEQGLSQATVNVLYQDKQGYLWIGTDDGLNRFDGKEIIKHHSSFNQRDSLAASEIYALTEDNKGVIYIGHYNAGISCFDKATKKFTHITSAENGGNHLSNPKVYGLAYLNNGYIWARTSLGISKINPFNYQVKNYDNPLFAEEFVASNIDIVEYKSHVWFGSITKGLLAVSKDGSIIRTNWNINIHGKTVTGITVDRNNLWVCSEKGIFKISMTGEAVNIDPFLLNTKIFGTENKILLDDKNGNIWIGTSGKGVVIINAKDNSKINIIKSFGINDNLGSNIISTLLKDKENTIIIGTGRGVVFHSPASRIINNYRNVLRNLKGFDHPIYAIHELSPELLLLGNRKGVHLFNTNTLEIKTVYFKPVKEASLTIYHFTPIERDLFIVCTGEGVYELSIKNGNFSISSPKKFKELAVLKSIAITDIHLYNDSIAFVASYSSGLFKWNLKKHTVQNINGSVDDFTKKIVDTVIVKIEPAKDGRLLLCTENGFSIFNPTKESYQNFKPGTNYPFQLPGSNIKYAYDDGNEIWIATFGQGLQIYNKQSKKFRSLTSKNLLPNNAVYAILAGIGNDLWVPTNDGLALVNKVNNSIRTFTSYDGLPDNEFNGFAATKGKSGLLYFSTLNGLVSVNPAIISSDNFSPPIQLTSVIVKKDSTTITYNTYQDNKLIVPAGYNAITINFAALSFAAPEKIQYKVMMEGVDNSWIDLGNRTEMRYGVLPPKEYTFKIMAMNAAGTCSNVVFERKILIKPLWHQQTWFDIVKVLLVLLAMFGIFKLRIIQLKKEQKIRAKLALDLHDDLGGTLNSIKVYVNLALLNHHDDPVLQKIKYSCQQSISDLRDLIWVMDDKKNLVDDLVRRIRKFAEPLVEVNGIDFSSNISPESLHYKLKPAEKRNLYMIIKEAINNSIKYAGAKQLKLDIELLKNKLSIAIKDCGKGFNTESKLEGNGLSNMKVRAEEINYSIAISCCEGTSIQLHKN